MIVYNLSCINLHHFDGWFRSSQDFDTQLKSGLMVCPSCGDVHISKQLSAPRLNIGATANPESAIKSSGGFEVLSTSLVPSLQAHLLQQFKSFVLSNTVNVGGDFANAARRMHYGEEPQRNIRGRVTAADASALQEEGVEAVPIPAGIFLDEGVQ